MASVQSVDRAVALLKAIATAPAPSTAGELALACGINRSTAWRLLSTLEANGLVERDRITQRYLDQADPPKTLSLNWMGRPIPLHATSSGKVFLAWLPEQERESLLSGGLEAYTARTITDRDQLEAELAEIRRVGYGTCLGEFEDFSNGASAAVLDRRGRPVVIVNIWGPSQRVTRGRLPALGRTVLQTAHEISAGLE